MISCGEASGDLYAGALGARASRRATRACRIVGFGGEHLRAAGAELAGDYRGFAVTGLTEALRVVPRSFAPAPAAASHALARDRPDVFVAIDFPDFNFRLASAVHALGIPVVYYVSPQLWAWRHGRIHAMKRFVSKVLVIFPFEVPIYEREGDPGRVRRPPARRSDPGRRAARTRSLRSAWLDRSRADRCAAARQPAQRTARDGWRSCAAAARSCRSASPACSSSSRARRSCATRCSRRSRPLACRLAIVEGRTDDVLHAARRGHHGLGHRDGADGAARAADGDRLPARRR